MARASGAEAWKKTTYSSFLLLAQCTVNLWIATLVGWHTRGQPRQLCNIPSCSCQRALSSFLGHANRNVAGTLEAYFICLSCMDKRIMYCGMLYTFCVA